MDCEISVIVPFYNVEKYIEQCVISLFEQDFVSIEYIFVNDASIDCSDKILREVMARYPNRALQSKIIKHEKNKGVGAARKTGILAMKGEYCIQIDADDWVDLDMFSLLHKKAIDSGADIVYSNSVLHYSGFTKIQRNNSENIVSDLLYGRLSGSLCDRLVLSSIYKENRILPHDELKMGEDILLNLELYLSSEKTAFLNEAPYHYRQTNETSLTTCYDIHSLYSHFNFLKLTEKLLLDEGLFDQHKLAFYSNIVNQFPLYVQYKIDKLIISRYPQAIKPCYVENGSWKIKLAKQIFIIIYKTQISFLKKLISKIYFNSRTKRRK